MDALQFSNRSNVFKTKSVSSNYHEHQAAQRKRSRSDLFGGNKDIESVADSWSSCTTGSTSTIGSTLSSRTFDNNALAWDEDAMARGHQPSRKVRFPLRVNPQKPQLAIDYSQLMREMRNPNQPSSPVSPSLMTSPWTKCQREVLDGAALEMARLERLYAPDPDYLSRHPTLNPKMRAVLVDWLFEVGSEYMLRRETLYVAINYVDRYLSEIREAVPRGDLQLIGVTALWLASKVEEILPLPVSDYAQATELSCSTAQISETEVKMVHTLQWHLLPCTAYAFANKYLQALAEMKRAGVPALAAVSPRPTDSAKPWMVASVVPPILLIRVMEVLDLAMMDPDAMCFLPSVLAATAVTVLVERDSGNFCTTADIECVTQIPRRDLTHCVDWFSFTLELVPNPNNSKPYVTPATTPPRDYHTIQRYNTEAINVYKDVAGRRSFARHPSAVAHRSKTTCASFVRISDEEESLDDEGELRSSVTPVSVDLGSRAFSPLTQISFQLERTTVTGSHSVDCLPRLCFFKTNNKATEMAKLRKAQRERDDSQELEALSEEGEC